MPEWTALNLIVHPCAGQKCEPEDRAEYSDSHDAGSNRDLAFQEEFAVGERFMGDARSSSQEP